MDKDPNERKFKINTKDNIMNAKSNREKIMTSKFFTPMPPVSSIQLPPKKPVLSKRIRKSREMYRDRIISSEEVSRKKIKLDKEKAEAVSRVDVASKSGENDDEFFEKIRQKYENDKAKGLLVGGSQQKNVRKVKKLFSDECVQLMNNFKESRKNHSPAVDATKISGFKFTENPKSIKTLTDNFSTQSNYSSNVLSMNNSAYRNDQNICNSSTFILESPSSYVEDQKFLADLERDEFISDLESESVTHSLSNQLLSFSNLENPIIKMRTPPNLPKFLIPPFSVNDASDGSLSLTPFSFTSSPKFNSIHDNNYNPENYIQNSMVVNRPKYLF